MSDYLLGPVANLPYSGQYRIIGVTTELNVPGSYPVGLYIRPAGALVRSTVSAADGTFEFNYIQNRPEGYFAIVFDAGADPKNAAALDYVSPEPMP